VRRQAEGAGAGSVLKESTTRTLEVVPPFERLHATEHGVEIRQVTIAGGTPQLGRRNFGVPGDGGRPRRAPTSSFAWQTRFLAHACGWSNRLATSRPRNRVHLTAAVSFFERRGVLSRTNRTTKLSPPATFMSFGFPDEPGRRKDCRRSCLWTSDNRFRNRGFWSGDRT
jgi:hypothetical protein